MSSDHGYKHERPRRPPNLPKRLEPPPERPTFDMSWLIYIGIGLAAIMLILAIPYVITYLVNLVSS